MRITSEMAGLLPVMSVAFSLVTSSTLAEVLPAESMSLAMTAERSYLSRRSRALAMRASRESPDSACIR